MANERAVEGGAPPDWARATGVRFGVRQEFRYDYTAPVTDLRQRLVLLPPPTHGDQHLVAGTLTVRGADQEHVVETTDRFDNRVHRVTSPLVREAVVFTVEYIVERHAGRAPARVRRDADLTPYLTATRLTAPNDTIRAAADRIARGADPVDIPEPGLEALSEGARRQWALAHRASEWTAHALAYRPGVTGVTTAAADTLSLGCGVCQDFAHVVLAVLRQLGVPSRYVSGHLLGEGAPHAWIEALLPDPAAPMTLRAVAYDPTHRRRTGLDYITVATGRDYDDVAPTSGSFTGEDAGTLTAAKDAWVIAATEGDA